ncbi:MAG: carboxypeptidase regulatory-like domain-containing protein [Deltaproteobacteria bacterium]|nr:carboxypeptidase regulatory-like domain-containing protein [Deltaproteobacteria bacterium]
MSATVTVAQHAATPGRSLVQVEVRGTLRDDLGMGLPGAELEVVIAPEAATAVARRVRTDTAGHFGVIMPVAPGTARLVVEYAGDELHASTTYTRAVDLGKADVTLQLVGPRQVVVTTREIRVELSAFSDEGSVGLPIVVTDERDAELARGTTDVSGRWTFTLPTARLGRPGARTIRTSFAGDARRNAASTTHRVLVRSPSFLSLRADRVSLAPGDSVALDGQLLDHEGPVRDAAVGVFAGSRHLGTATTDRAGAFSMTFPLDEDDRGTLRLGARYVPDVPWREPAQSPEVIVRVIPPRPVPVAWIAAIVAGTALLLAAAQLVKRPADREQAKRTRPAPPPRPGIALGLSPPRARVMLTSISGRVSDVDDPASAPIEGAVVRITRGDEILVDAVTDAAGDFVIDELPHGRLAITIESEGYEAQRSHVAIPHRGEWSGLDVKLESRRRRIERIFRSAVVPGLVSEERYAVSTAREVARDASVRRAARLDELVEIAEKASYGAEPPSPASVARAREALERVLPSAPRRTR